MEALTKDSPSLRTTSGYLIPLRKVLEDSPTVLSGSPDEIPPQIKKNGQGGGHFVMVQFSLALNFEEFKKSEIWSLFETG